MQKRQLTSPWTACLLLVFLSAILAWPMFTPITEATGIHFTKVLESASANRSFIFLDFDYTERFHIVHAQTLEVLLEEKALGKEYEIIARYHHQRGSRGYYEVLALSDADGTIYLTLEQSEAIRQAMLPKRLALLAALDAAGCMLILFIHKKKKAAGPAGKEAATHEAESSIV